jgi:hypothetical protein
MLKLEYFPTENWGISLLATLLILVCLRLPAIHHQTPYEREEKSIFLSYPWTLQWIQVILTVLLGLAKHQEMRLRWTPEAVAEAQPPFSLWVAGHSSVW